MALNWGCVGLRFGCGFEQGFEFCLAHSDLLYFIQQIFSLAAAKSDLLQFVQQIFAEMVFWGRMPEIYCMEYIRTGFNAGYGLIYCTKYRPVD